MSNAAFSGLTGGKLNDTWAKYQTSQYRMRSRTSALKGYLQMWLNEDFSSELSKAKIKTPVLVIGGRNDLPGFQEAHYNDTIAKWVPNIRFEYIDNAGHFPMYETPVLLATLIEKHLDAHN
jgi:pimeloyl-ACP methyl ester carboxylesterase